MRTSNFRTCGTVVVSLASLVLVCGRAHGALVAYDDADLYPSNPDSNWPAYNGGFGYDAWTPLTDTGGGGTYMEGVGVNNRQVAGNYSFALYSGSGSYDISRQLVDPVSDGSFSIITRFDLAGAGPNLVNLRSGNNLGGFGDGELISFGLVNGNELSYTDGSGFHLLSSGEARGDVWDWTVNFDADTGSYSLSVTNLGGGYATTVDGGLEATNTTVGSFAVINSSTGGNQNLIFDLPTFMAVPEPASLAAAAGVTALFSLVSLRRRG